MRSPGRAGLLAAVLALALRVLAPAVALPADPFEFATGIVVDPVLGVVYAMNHERGIDAVEIGSGKMLWRSNAAAKPLLRVGDRLVAQTEPASGAGSPLRIALLDARDGAAKARLVDVALPSGVRPSIDDGLDHSFAIVAREPQAGEVLLTWTYSEQPATGARPDVEQTERHAATGGARIDLASGRIETVAPATPRPGPEVPTAIVALIEAKALSGPVARVGAQWVAVDRTSRGKEQRVRIRRWDAATGEELAAVTLYDGALGFRSLSADQRHLLASRRDPSDGRSWHWSVFSLATGAKLGEVRSDSAGARFFVQDGVLVHEADLGTAGDAAVATQRALRAVRLDTGIEVWLHEVRDPRYRGPYPARGTR